MSASNPDTDAVAAIQRRAAGDSCTENGPDLVIAYADTLWSPPSRPRDPGAIADQRLELAARAVYVIEAMKEAGEIKKYLPAGMSVSPSTIYELATMASCSCTDLDAELEATVRRYAREPHGFDGLKALCRIVALVADATRHTLPVERVITR
jgi:hypothetical protein